MLSAETSILLSLQKLSGAGVVNSYKFENESNFTAIVRATSGRSEEKNASFYNRWCTNWIQTFSQETYTNWIVRYTYPSMQKCHFKKVFKCQHNSFDKVKKRKRDDTARQRNKGCDATITIIFKKINRHTIRNDPLLRQQLDIHIQISYHHTHKINVVEAYRYLRMTPDTQETFFKYFNDGMTPAVARGFHETKLEFGLDDNKIPVVLANAQINPTERQVKHLYYKWRKDHFDGRELALGENGSPEFYDVMSTDVETKLPLADNGNTNLCEEYSTARGFHGIKLENETDANDIPAVLGNEQSNPTEQQEKQWYCKWKEEHFGGRELTLEENVSSEFFYDMSTDVEIKNEMVIDTVQIDELRHQDNNFVADIINTVDVANRTNLCEEYSAARGFHRIKLENESDDNEISCLANEQNHPTERQVKHLYCEKKEENFDGCELADVEENEPPELYDDMSSDEEKQNELPVNTERINKVVHQDNNFATEIVNTIDDANGTNLCREHSAAVLQLSEHLERISKIASNSKTVDMTNAIKKFNETLTKIKTPTDLLNFVHS